MFSFSAALRSVRGTYTRTSTRLRRSGVHPASTLTGGGPYLHWVPDRPDGCRLAGEYLPPAFDTERAPTVSRRPRRRR